MLSVERWTLSAGRLKSPVRTESLQIRSFVDGQFIEPVSGGYFDNIEPATGKPYSKVADSDARDVDLAVAAADTARQPRGIAGLISPWNLPLYLLSWKIAPAIAVGNTAIAKPSELTPMTAFMLCEIARQAGLPNGVLNVVHGTGPNVGAAITAH